MKLNEEEVVIAEPTVEEAPAILPAEFLTSYISECWSRISELKATTEAINQSFKDAHVTKVNEILQSLTDAYLIAVGQFENCLADIQGIAVPETDVAAVKPAAVIAEPAKPADAETVIATEIDPVKAEEESPKDDKPAEEEPVEVEKDDLDDDEIDDEDDKKKKNSLVGDEFEYFVDFDEPVGEKPTDDDIYGDQK